MSKVAIKTIPAYQFTPRPIVAYSRFYNSESKKFTPASKAGPSDSGPLDLHELLDSITFAVEAGIVPVDGWLKFLFGTEKAFEEFLDELETYDETFRITDQWWTALSTIVGGQEEEGFITCADIAEGLREDARQSGQY